MAVVEFLRRHITGQYGIYRSFFLHFVLLYFVLVFSLVAIDVPFALGIGIFGVAMAWGAIGSVVSCVTEVRRRESLVIHKLASVAMLLVIAWAIYFSYVDLKHLAD